MARACVGGFAKLRIFCLESAKPYVESSLRFSPPDIVPRRAF
jgi:hypothetical protein